jgi:hypothetical protein
MQSRIDLNVMPLMLSYRFRVLHPVALFVPVIFHHIVVSVLPNIASYTCLSDAVGGCLLFVSIAILVLILNHGSSRANRCQCYGCENRSLHGFSYKRYFVWGINSRIYEALRGPCELSKIAQNLLRPGAGPLWCEVEGV